MICPRCQLAIAKPAWVAEGSEFTVGEEMPWGGTTFRWNISAARRMVEMSAHEIHLAPVDVVIATTSEIDPQHVPHVDPIRPGISILLPGTEFAVVIDGRHRAVRAKQLGLAVMPTFILTAEEEQVCRVFPRNLE